MSAEAGGGVEAALPATDREGRISPRRSGNELRTGSCSLPTRVGFHSDQVRGGINYRF
jgi:hypothetical protein